MNEWKEWEIEHLIRDGILVIGDGYRAKNAELAAEGLPFARAGNINNGFKFAGADCFPIQDLRKVGNKRSQHRDIVFTSKGTVGRFAYVAANTEPFVYSPQLCFWRSQDQEVIDSHWLYYWMNGREFWQQAHSVKDQTDMADYVSLSDQRKMRITLPLYPNSAPSPRSSPASTTKFDLLHRQNKTLEAMAETLFRQWFDKAKLGKCGFGRLGDYITETVGGDWGKENHQDGYCTPVYCMRGTDIGDLALGLPRRMPVRFIKEKKLAKGSANSGDILLEISSWRYPLGDIRRNREPIDRESHLYE